MAKPLNLPDERNLTWAIVPSDRYYKRLKSARLQAGDLACWRDQMVQGFARKAHLDIARARLDEITQECLVESEANDPLIDRLVHAAKAYITLHVYAQTDPGK